MLADAMRWPVPGIWKDVNAMANLDKLTAPAVGNALVHSKAEEASHSGQSATLKERMRCCAVWATVSVSSRSKYPHSRAFRLTSLLHARGRQNLGSGNDGSDNDGSGNNRRHSGGRGNCRHWHLEAPYASS